MKATSFLKFAVAAAVLVGAVSATATLATHRLQAPVDAPPTAAHVSPPQEANPLDTATPGLTPSMLADNLIMTLKVKIVGQWGEFGVFDIKAGPQGLKFPLTVDGHTYDNVYALSTQLLPLDSKQTHTPGVMCDVVCWDLKDEVIGYDLAAYSAHAKQQGMLSIPPNQLGYIQGLEKLSKD
jgi:hypothetical protein